MDRDMKGNGNMIKTAKNRLSTIGEIARRFDASVHQVEYVLRTRDIAESAWAGHARVFGPTEVERIGVELRRIAAEKGNSHAS
jgi:hypothetical protein